MFLSMSVKKSSAKGIRNTEKIYNFVIVGYFYIKALIPVFGCSFCQTMTLKSRERQGE